MEKTACKGQCRSVLEECGVLCVTVGGGQWMLLWSVTNWITLPLVSFLLHFCSLKSVSFFTSDAISYTNAHFGTANGPVHIQNVQCFGNESRLEDCSNMTSSCSHSYDAGVSCLGKLATLCIFSFVLTITILYNTHVVKCPTEGQMRLVGGDNLREGRIEVCFGEAWTTICDALWSTADANVVCQQLGYSSNGRNVLLYCMHVWM